MKPYALFLRKALFGFMLQFFIGLAIALAQQHTVSQFTVPVHRLELSTHKTSSLIFPFPVKKVDRGSAQVLAQLAEGVENVLHVKARNAEFRESNLTVITTDNQLYMFDVRYAEHPETHHMVLKPIERHQKDAWSFIGRKKGLPQGQIVAASRKMLASVKPTVDLRDKKMDLQISLNGLFVCAGKLFFRMKLRNKSDIGYPIGQFRTFLQDKKQLKRTAIQEKELPISWHVERPELIEPESEQTILFSLDTFTIPVKKQLIIQIMEEDGARNFSLKVTNGHLKKAASFD